MAPEASSPAGTASFASAFSAPPAVTTTSWISPAATGPNQPIIQYYNNVFVGASDDILDLDGTDAWIEGNIFLHAHKNGSPDTSSAISGGNYDFGASGGVRTSEITIIGNLFFDCDQAATAKQGNFFTLLNNTIVHTTKTGGEDFASGVVNVRDTTPVADRLWPGFLSGRQYHFGTPSNSSATTTRLKPRSRSTTTSCPCPGPGRARITSLPDPLLKYIPQVSETYFTNWQAAQVMRDWFSLLPGSPARGTGPNGRTKAA